MKGLATAHVAGCKQCGRDEDGGIEPCAGYWETVMGFEPGSHIAVWPDGRFRHYDRTKGAL